MTSWPAAVLFDFDGVIVNSEPLHLLAFQEVFAAEHLDLTSEEYFRDLIGFDDGGVIKHFYASRKLPLEPKTLLRLLTRKGEMTMELIGRQHYHALPGVEEFVRGLWRHYPLAICSGARREEIEAMLEGVKLRDCFPTIVAAEDVPVAKPDPAGYLLTTKLVSERVHAHLKPADCLIIEDAPTVIRSVRKVGFSVLAVANSYPPEELGDADYVVKHLHPREVHGKIPGLKLGI
jgi:HAD superfamily hydrolase (TIGR01509 family)